jgi:hypothetical protein
MPHGIFPAAAALRALSLRQVRAGSRARGDWQPRRIASVRTSEGLRFTLGLTDESEPGTTIELFEEGTAPFGIAKT